MIGSGDIAFGVVRFLGVQSLYAMVLFPLVLIMVKGCRGRHPGIQHGLWLLILLRLVLPPDMAAPWSAGHLIRSVVPHALSSDPLVSPVLRTAKHRPQPRIAPPADSRPHPERHPENHGKRAEPLSLSELRRPALVVFGVWLMTAGLLLAQFCSKRRRYWRMARQARAVQDSAAQAILRDWCRRLDIRRPVSLRAAASDVPAFAIGLRRPMVVVPGQLVSAGRTAALEPVLAHELVHVKRRDDLAICLQELIRILYFFHPLAWFAATRLSWTREAMCDAAVLSHGTLSPSTYGRQLLARNRGQTLPSGPTRALARFTAAARAMAFRLNHIKKEGAMRSQPLRGFLAVVFMGLFLLPMAPVASSDSAAPTGAMDDALIQYVLNCVPCKNPEDVSQAVWGHLITEDFSAKDAAHLVALTDFDTLKDIGDGRKAHVFYLLSGSGRGVYRHNFHFVKTGEEMGLIFKSRRSATYATDRPRVNGRYEIEEGWRADLSGDIDDDRVTLAWAARVWFWTGDRYLPAYTETTIAAAADASLLGTTREWNPETRSAYEAAPRE
jgi:beta-lactamase regulating signal transducer with metallopeptidase domain